MRLLFENMEIFEEYLTFFADELNYNKIKGYCKKFLD